MSDSKKPTVSEIEARELAARVSPSYPNAADIPYLLDLVKRLGGMTNRLIFSHHHDRHEGLEWEDCDYPKCRAARALLKEIKQ
jgi:hypothetical protein